MPVLGLAALDVHELVKFQDTSLAAAPPFTALVEDGCARVVDALLLLSIPALVCSSTCLPPAGHTLLERDTRVVVFGLWRRRW